MSRLSAVNIELKLFAAAFSSVSVVEAFDVVFTEVAAGLDLYQFQRYLPGVFKPVHGPERDIGGFVFSDGYHFVAFGDAGCSPDYYPVLGAVMVSLQRETCPGIDSDALDLETVCAVYALVSSPGPVHPPVKQRLAPFLCLEMRNNIFYLLVPCLFQRPEQRQPSL